MADTKQNILLAALRLFARDGYGAVSTSMIAGELGMTKGALYKHYPSKQAIFDAIVERMFALDAERSQECDVPQETYEAAPETYGTVTLDDLRRFAMGQLEFWTKDPFGSDFRRMLAHEQYRDPRMNDLYQSCVVSGPADYLEDVFREMMARGALAPGDPHELAFEYYAPMFYLICLGDSDVDRGYAAELLERHIDRFEAEHTGGR